MAEENVKMFRGENRNEKILVKLDLHFGKIQVGKINPKICMIFGFVTIPCTTNDVITQIYKT